MIPPYPILRHVPTPSAPPPQPPGGSIYFVPPSPTGTAISVNLKQIFSINRNLFSAEPLSLTVMPELENYIIIIMIIIDIFLA
jgi:hypothetical protein